MTEVRHLPCGTCQAEKSHLVGVPRVSEQAKTVTPVNRGHPILLLSRGRVRKFNLF